MNREDLRTVEYTVTEKTKAKKGKKSGTKKVKKIGYFHLWGSNSDSKGKEKFFGLVEEANGKLLEVGYKDIKFLSDFHLDEVFEIEEDDLTTEAADTETAENTTEEIE